MSKSNISPIQAAQLWCDAALVLGSGSTASFPSPNHTKLSWSDFSKKYFDTSGSGSSDDICEMVSEWLDIAKDDPSAMQIVFNACDFCFESDSEACETDGGWSVGDGALCAVWPKHAPNEFGSYFPNPMDFTNFSQSHDGVYVAGVAAVSGKDALTEAYIDLVNLGLNFNILAQKNFNTSAEYDPKNHLDCKVVSIISKIKTRKSITYKEIIAL